MGYETGEYSRYTVTAGSVDTVHRRGSLDYKDLSFQGVPEVQKHIYFHNPRFSYPLSTKAFPAAPPSPAVCW